jgi:hypothetical protein
MEGIGLAKHIFRPLELPQRTLSSTIYGNFNYKDGVELVG